MRGIGIREPFLLLALALLPAPADAVAQQEGVQWQVEGRQDSLQPTYRVRLIMENGLAPDVADPTLGLIQVVSYLYAADGSVASVLESAAKSRGLQVAESDPLLTAAGTRVTVEVAGLNNDEPGALVALGRPIKVAGQSGSLPVNPEAVRADPSDLADRLKWGNQTLIRPGDERRLWEGSVPMATDRIYADFIAVRAARQNTAARNGSEAAPEPMPEGGILGISPTATAGKGGTMPVARGSTLLRATSGHVQRLTLTRGVLNEVRLRAEVDVTGSLVVAVTVRAEKLQPVP